MSRRTSPKLTAECERRLEKARKIVASGPDDNPPISVVIDAAHAYLVESEENIRNARDEYNPVIIQELCNTSVIGLQYRTRIKAAGGRLIS